MNPSAQQSSTLRWWVMGLMWLGGATAVGSFHLLQQAFTIQEPLMIILLMALTSLLPLLLNWQLLRTVTLLATVLPHLAQRHQLASLPTLSYWPFHHLLAHVNVIAGQGRDIAQVRGAFVEQVREAAAQEERQRLARDLHDSIKQQIFGMNISAATAQARFATDPDGALQAIGHLQGRATEVMDEMDTLLQQLRPAPLEQMGLIQAIQEQCTSLGYRTGAQVTVDIDDLPPDEQFEIGAQEHIYRIIQEALSNIARHARAHTVHIQLQNSSPDHLQLTIYDDGQGFDTKQTSAGMGLGNIQARAKQLNGNLQITSVPQKGTTLQIKDIPVNQSLPITHLVTPEAIEMHLQTQQMRDNRFYTILIILFVGVPILWQLLQTLIYWLPDTDLRQFLNMPLLGIILLIWFGGQLIESRQWLNTSQLDANLAQSATFRLKRYAVSRQVFSTALLGYLVTYGIYSLSRFLPTVWLYERPLAITILLTTIFFASITALFLWQHIKTDRQILYAQTPNQQELSLDRQKVIDLLRLIFVTVNTLMWMAIVFLPDTWFSEFSTGLLVLFFTQILSLALIAYILYGLFKSVTAVFDAPKGFAQRITAFFQYWGQAVTQVQPIAIPTLLTALFWLLTIDILTDPVGGMFPTSSSPTVDPIIFWAKTVMAITLITLWSFTFIRWWLVYHTPIQEVSTHD